MIFHNEADKQSDVFAVKTLITGMKVQEAVRAVQSCVCFLVCCSSTTSSLQLIILIFTLNERGCILCCVIHSFGLCSVRLRCSRAVNLRSATSAVLRSGGRRKHNEGELNEDTVPFPQHECPSRDPHTELKLKLPTQASGRVPGAVITSRQIAGSSSSHTDHSLSVLGLSGAH